MPYYSAGFSTNRSDPKIIRKWSPLWARSSSPIWLSEKSWSCKLQEVAKPQLIQNCVPLHHRGSELQTWTPASFLGQTGDLGWSHFHIHMPSLLWWHRLFVQVSEKLACWSSQSWGHRTRPNLPAQPFCFMARLPSKSSHSDHYKNIVI